MTKRSIVRRNEQNQWLRSPPRTTKIAITTAWARAPIRVTNEAAKGETTRGSPTPKGWLARCSRARQLPTKLTSISKAICTATPRVGDGLADQGRFARRDGRHDDLSM